MLRLWRRLDNKKLQTGLIAAGITLVLRVLGVDPPADLEALVDQIIAGVLAIGALHKLVKAGRKARAK